MEPDGSTLVREDHSLTGDASDLRMTPSRDGANPEIEPTSGMHRVGTLSVIILPFIAFLIAIVLLWESKAVGPVDLSLLLFMHVIAGLGITVGFHRLFTHRSFESQALGARNVRGVRLAGD